MVANLHLLVVDDEPALLQLLKRFLERAGFKVDLALSSTDAIQLFEQNRYALVVTDLTMEGMDGEELARELRKLRPDIPILLTSGYPYVPQTPNVAFLQKPFLPAMLIDAVKNALGT